ncbi:hypothetical protein [Streptomyces sp. G1]|uniref:hypothetical protein n=1 Tax=Streptomyces sp. G1 TaxID=361572 RepID=UPI002030E21B|nr:hypothetical protein [Streptomyces sp. G1]MCM1964893.1 hypothetical protein [Streptomyces sp. G1]
MSSDRPASGPDPLTPSSCRWCSIPAGRHYQQWTAAAGWHPWTAPTREQIKERMRARRAARQH